MNLAKTLPARFSPSRNSSIGIVCIGAVFSVFLLFASTALASKQVTNYIGSSSLSGSAGGEFSRPRDIAVNTTGAGPANVGDIYVADEENNRIQRFDEDGSFISAWGANVVTEPVTEVQKLSVTATAGTYKLSFEGATTSDIPFDAGRFEVQTALQELPTMGPSGLASVGVSGSGPFRIRFESFSFNESSLSATNVPQISVEGAQLAGTASVETIVQGMGQFERCTAAGSCRAGAGTGAANEGDNAKNGSLLHSGSIAVDGDTGDVYVVDAYNRRINEYTGDGSFIRSFGWGVDASTPGEGYEVCPASDRCTYGVAGSGEGQLGNRGQTLGIAISPPDGNPATGTVFLADPENRRIDTFALDGTDPASIGSEATFEEDQPRKVAVDSRGIVYASNSANSDEIERYDSENADGGGVGFLEPIATPPLLEGPSGEATAGLAVGPDEDGAGPEQDVLYVLRGSWSDGGVVQQYGPTNSPGLTAAPTAVDDTHGTEAGFSAFNVTGLGFDPGSGDIFVSDTDQGSRVYVLGEAPAPEATLDPVTQHDARSATFTGTVEPNGALTGYHFEYVNDTDFQASGFEEALSVPIADVSAGHGENPVPVEAQTPHHLVPGTLYHVRLVAKRAYSDSEAVSGAQTFTTQGAAPTIEGIDASVSSPEEATLLGTIDASNQAVTAYQFEWGTSPSYGNLTPVRSLPSSSEPVAVSEELTGLTPGQTYHFRLLAENAAGPVASADETFTMPAGLAQFPQRGFEIASEYPSDGVPVLETGGTNTPSEDGNSVVAAGPNPLGHSTLPPLPDGPAQNGGPIQYVFTREAGSWQHRNEVGLGSLAEGGASWSGDLQRFLTVTETEAPGSGYPYEDARVDPDDRNGSLDVYEWQPDGKLTWISRDPRIPIGQHQTEPGQAGVAGVVGSFTMSADGKTVVFKSQRQLLDADTTPPSEQSGEVGPAPFRLYKWENGQLSFVGSRPDGSVPTNGSRLGDYGTQSLATRYAVSRDGSRVVFGAQRKDGVEGGAIYVQTDGEPTVEATKEEGVPPLPAPQPYDVTYRGAAANDSRVFFTSASRFTADSGAGAAEGGAQDLYAYDVADNKLRDLTPRLDGLDDPTVNPASANQARVLGVLANSEDGKRVYFVAEGRYPTGPNPEGSLPQASAPNLYLAELASIDGPVKLRFVATLASEDNGDWTKEWIGESGGALNRGKTALASPDGSVVGFASYNSLTGQPLGGTEQLFVYEAKTGRLDCASCSSDGTLPAANVNEYVPGLSEPRAYWQQANGVRRWVSSNGTIYFNTATALLPADENTVNDIYEFREGRLHLVTTGRGTTDSIFAGASVDGSTVFFQTQETLAPQDKEPGVPKLYAARVGGGFPYVPPPVPCDFNAGACEGAPTTAPKTPGAGTSAFEGPGNQKPKQHKKKHHKKKHHKKRHHKKKTHHRRNAKHHAQDHSPAKHNRRASR